MSWPWASGGASAVPKKSAALALPPPAPDAVELVDEITLDQRRVIVRCLDLPLESVKLDPRNPRIANTVRLNDWGDGARLQAEITAQETQNARLRERNRTLAAEVQDLKKGTTASEERARTDLGMVGKSATV